MFDGLSRLATALVHASLDASLLLLVILGFKVLVGRRYPGRWHAAVWLVLMLRLGLPAPLLSLKVPAVLPGSPITEGGSPARVARAYSTPASHPLRLPNTMPGQSPVLVSWSLLPLLWAAGALATAAFFGAGACRFWLTVRKGRVVTAEPVLKLLEDTKGAMGIRVLVGLVETDRVAAPALFGFLRPRILVPLGFFQAMDAGEIRSVFRHECAHLKRHDILLGWLACLLQVLHWFNPLVWLAFRQWRKDRELACDETAVWRLDATSTARYGHDLLHLFERLKGPEPLPNLAGVLESSSNLSRRILMLAHLAQGPRRRWPFSSLVALAAISGVALAGLEGAPSARISAQAPAPAPATKAWPGFVNDPDLAGGWRTVDFVQDVADFKPGQRFSKDGDYLLESFFHLDGTGSDRTTNGVTAGWKWTKGKVYAGSPTEGRYEIREEAGRTFLFFQWMNDDVLFRGQRPHWVVQEKAPGLREVRSRVRDRTKYPFEDDPACLGKWSTVDFVEQINDFKPGKPSWKGDLAFKGLDFLPGGKTSKDYRWTRGLLLQDHDHTASRYEIHDLNGSRYLIMEWKSGDYIFGGRRPWYYVLKAQ